MSNQPEDSGRVVIALRKRLDADLLRRHLSGVPSLIVQGASVDTSIALEISPDDPISVAILDAGFPEQLAFDVGAMMLSEGRTRQVLFLDDYYHPRRATRAEAMPAAYCSRSISLGKLTENIMLLAADESLCPNRVNELVDPGHQHRLDSPISGKLSTREFEVVTLLAEGHSTGSCAEQLKLSPSTVDNHKWRLMKKLQVTTTIDLIRLAIRCGLVEP